MSDRRVDKGLEVGNQAWHLVMRQGLSLKEAAALLEMPPLRVARIVVSLARKRFASLEQAVNVKRTRARRKPEAQLH